MERLPDLELEVGAGDVEAQGTLLRRCAPDALREAARDVVIALERRPRRAARSSSSATASPPTSTNPEDAGARDR